MKIDPFTEDTLHIRWSQLGPDKISESVERSMATASERLQAIAARPEDGLTFANTFGELEEATAELSRAWGRVGHLDSVCNSEALREAYNGMLPTVSAFYAQIPLNGELWKALKLVSNDPSIVSALKPIEKRLMDVTLRDFIQNGADLDPEKKTRFEAIKKDLAEKTQKYSEHVLDATNAWDLVIGDDSRLTGLPTTALNAARASAEEKEHTGKWRFTLQAPSYLPVMQYLDDADIRRQVSQALSKVGREKPHSNATLLTDILTLRQESAELLGQSNFADHVLEPRMAKDGKTALGFIEDLHTRILGQFKTEIDELQTFKASETAGDASEPLEAWDFGYWAEKLRKQRYDFDAESLRPYFAIDQVISGMFEITEELFGIQLESIDDPGVEVWHPEVKFYNVRDTNGEMLGCFYADWHPRESKRGGAWMNYLRTGTPPQKGKTREAHVGLICGNLTPSVDGKPALLTHGEVETIFHEFGHLLHHLLGNVEIKSLNGVNVVWDFVELPSQIMENFCWERVSLDRFARHHETHAPIPEDLFERMKAARNFQSAMFNMRQLSFSKMDLDLHMHYANYEGKELDHIIDAILEDYQAPTKSPRPNNSHNFNHLFSSPTGYAAGYYSYKWAEVLDADAFTKFKDHGVISSKVGQEFRDKILSQGNGRDANELYEDFMGRPPRLDALLNRSGLV